MANRIRTEYQALVGTVQVLPGSEDTFINFENVTPLPCEVDSIAGINTDTIAHVVTLRITNGGTPLILGSATIPAGAGIDGNASVDVLALALPATCIPFILDGANSLQGAAHATITATKEVVMIATIGYI